jgi:hypothetical protein
MIGRIGRISRIDKIGKIGKRGKRSKKHSCFAPEEGYYKYNGVYRVDKY